VATQHVERRVWLTMVMISSACWIKRRKSDWNQAAGWTIGASVWAMLLAFLLVIGWIHAGRLVVLDVLLCGLLFGWFLFITIQ
jgi:Ca2+/Na+ antiporter